MLTAKAGSFVVSANVDMEIREMTSSGTCGIGNWRDALFSREGTQRASSNETGKVETLKECFSFTLTLCGRRGKA